MLGAPRRRWRAMDDKQHQQANLVLKALLVIVLVVISWPLALLVAALFGANYLDRYVPEKHAWARRALIPSLIAIVAITYPFYNGSLADMGTRITGRAGTGGRRSGETPARERTGPRAG